MRGGRGGQARPARLPRKRGAESVLATEGAAKVAARGGDIKVIRVVTDV